MFAGLCGAVLCTILCLGLWPFHAPKNAANWLVNQNGIFFGKFGTAFSLRPLSVTGPPESRQATVEVWLQPRRIWDSGTFLAFYRAPKFGTSFRQSQADLLFQSRAGPANAPETFYVDDVFRRGQPVFITLTSNTRGVSVYLNGILVATNPSVAFDVEELAGRIILGASPGQPDEWSGQLFGLAVYQRGLTSEEVLRNYTAWKITGHPGLLEGSLVVYDFDEHTGRVIHNKVVDGVDLYFPEVYRIIDKTALEPFWNEFEMTKSYWKAVVKNVVGFVPFGFCFYAYFVRFIRPARSVLVTIASGTIVSVAIEVLQIFLPSRNSGTTDIITNTLGTWAGAEAYALMAPVLTRFSRSVNWR